MFFLSFIKSRSVNQPLCLASQLRHWGLGVRYGLRSRVLSATRARALPTIYDDAFLTDGTWGTFFRNLSNRRRWSQFGTHCNFRKKRNSVSFVDIGQRHKSLRWKPCFALFLGFVRTTQRIDLRRGTIVRIQRNIRLSHRGQSTLGARYRWHRPPTQLTFSPQLNFDLLWPHALLNLRLSLRLRRARRTIQCVLRTLYVAAVAHLARIENYAKFIDFV